MMNLRKKYITNLIILIFSSFILVSGQKPAKQSAIDNYSRGNYELAYDQFSDLLEMYPRDPLYRYYAGASLVNLKKDAGKAQDLLEQALKSNSLKSIPDDAVFYLARAEHLQGKYSDAEKTYGKFIAEAGKKRAKNLNVI